VHDDGSTLPERPEESLTAAGFADDEQSAALVRASLDSSEPRRRVLALRAARRRGLLTTDDWRRALVDAEREVRREAASLAARHEPPDAALDEGLVAALRDDDPLVVDAAAFALGERGCVTAVGPLCEVARAHDDARCRESAVAALGVLGDEGGLASVLGALEDKAPVRRRAIVALANFEGPEVEAALARARDDRDWQVRDAADQLGRED
jgi:HEAT repeat protein